MRRALCLLMLLTTGVAHAQAVVCRPTRVSVNLWSISAENVTVTGNLQVNGDGGFLGNTTDGGAPAANDPLYLAAAADDTGTGAGKVTKTVPAAGVVAQVGYCLDPANYAGAKTVVMVIAPQPAVQL